jgi:DNA-binding transcriptional MerR regulator
MPIVNDTPSIIYVREISEELGVSFLKIKENLKLSSNSEAVKVLISRYLPLEEKLKEKEKRIQALEKELEENKLILTKIKAYHKLIKSL